MISFKVKAVIFDMDGVITDTMPYHYRAWRKIFKAEGLSVSQCQIYMREGQPGNITVKEISSEYGLHFDKDRIKNILSKKEKLFKKIMMRRFIRGSRPFLHFLKNDGFKLGLVTGTARQEAIRILPKKILKIFDATITGDEVKKGKPHPEPYLAALKKLRVNAKEAVVIENAPFGISSAKRAGLACLAIESSLPRTYLKDADFVFHSFSQLRQKVSFRLAQ